MATLNNQKVCSPQTLDSLYCSLNIAYFVNPLVRHFARHE